MLSLSDPRWQTLFGGYRKRYDAVPMLQRLSNDWTDRGAWEELWSELHHQGDVGEASYAALTVLAELAGRASVRDWNIYALAAIVESERHASRNPPVPTWLAQDYRDAWVVLTRLALQDLAEATDPYLVRSTLAVVALARGVTKLGVMIAGLDDSELDAYLEEHLGWSQRYRLDLESPRAV
jgi:hypothetical protein